MNIDILKGYLTHLQCKLATKRLQSSILLKIVTF